MPVPRIYADFNGLVRGHSDHSRIAVVLDTYGSLKDLSNRGLILEQGMPLIAFDASDDEEDLEIHGVARYDSKRGWWVVEADELGVRCVPTGPREVEGEEFLCASCRAPVPGMTYSRMSPTETCPRCGTRVLAPFDPPVC